MNNLEDRIVDEFSALLDIGDSLVVRLNSRGQLINHSRRPVSNKLHLSHRVIGEHCVGAKQYDPEGVFILSRNKEGFRVNQFSA